MEKLLLACLDAWMDVEVHHTPSVTPRFAKHVLPLLKCISMEVAYELIKLQNILLPPQNTACRCLVRFIADGERCYDAQLSISKYIVLKRRRGATFMSVLKTGLFLKSVL